MFACALRDRGACVRHSFSLHSLAPCLCFLLSEVSNFGPFGVRNLICTRRLSLGALSFFDPENFRLSISSFLPGAQKLINCEWSAPHGVSFIVSVGYGLGHERCGHEVMVRNEKKDGR